MSRLLSFPGQGSKVVREQLGNWYLQKATFSDVDLMLRFTESLDQPETIAGCSNLLYADWRSKSKKYGGTTYVLGHSLGELNALNASVNGLAFQCKDIVAIAFHRNKLMVEATKKYLTASEPSTSSDRFELWAVMGLKSRNLRHEILESLTKSNADLYSSVRLANDNAPNQCVITGLSSHVTLWMEECEKSKLRYKFTQLNNPSGIPFHNNDVLRSIQEPLYDFIWNNLKENKNTHFCNEKVENSVVSNYDGQISEDFNTALEKFVLSSSNVVNFLDCCKELSSKPNFTTAYHFGPGTAVGKLVQRNLKLPNLNVQPTFID